MEIKNIVANLHPLERKILPYLSGEVELLELCKKSALSPVEAMRAVQWLSNRGALTASEAESEMILLGDNGKKYLKEGLPERRFLEAIADGEKTLAEIEGKAGLKKEEINICLGTLKGKAAIAISKGTQVTIAITEQGRRLLAKPSLEEQFLKRSFPLLTSSLQEEDRFAFSQLLRRKDIIRVQKITTKTITPTELGKKLSEAPMVSEEIVDRLTPAILSSGKWKGKRFRAYDLSVNVPSISGGRRHPVSEAIDYIKKIWLEMGFFEMKGSIIQTGFWDLDSLFVPQDHPARQMQDTFYIKDPAYGKIPSLSQKVKEIHENGGKTGSRGWGGKWSEKIASENLLRTHTTVLSARTLSSLSKKDLPAKFFSVGKVFRNEAVDWKHLFELTQVEGIVVDTEANFQNLKGYLREFFTKMGYADVRIRPAHFPYTEPSAEVDVYDSRRKKWIELGGSGIFRPEVTTPLLGFECPVLAWGLGMERIIAEYWNLSDIRDLYKNDLRQLKEMKAWMR